MKSRRRISSITLCLCVLVSLVPGLLLLFASATAADDQEESLLGTLSASYEASGPGVISSGEGDAGGKSYGAYQFASAYDIPKKFFEWCQKSDNLLYRSFGDTLSEAYYDGTPGYGTKFDAAWKKLAADNPSGFEQAQRNYVRLSYYDPIVSKAEANIPGFKVSNYSIALRNVLWSRAVQHSSGGALEVLQDAFAAIGGFKNQPESELIDAIYAESGSLTDSGKTKMSGATAERYGVSGKSMAWYGGCSGDVQLGVYIRLRINEPADAQAMLANYGYKDDKVGQGTYRILVSSNTKLGAVAGSTGLTMNTVTDSDSQRFILTYYASGYYTITNVSSGKRLTANSDGTVTLAAPTANNNQMWKATASGSGFTLKNRSTGTYLTASTFSAGSTIKMGSTATQWQLQRAGSDWSLEGLSCPSYTSGLTEGNSGYPFCGTLRCSYNIQKVTVSIINNKDNTNAISPASASGINAKSYDLGRLDSAVAFSRLKAGSYTCRITATSSAPTDSTFTREQPFYVVAEPSTITFNANGGKCATTTLKVNVGSVYGELPAATRDGCTFLGWYTAASGGTKIEANTIVPSGNRTLYAHYQSTTQYTFTFYDYDGKTVISSGKLNAGSTIPAPEAPTRPSDDRYYYTFTGWSGYTAGMKISQNVTFTARYEAQEISGASDITTTAYTISGDYLRAVPLGTEVKTMQGKLQPSQYVTIHKGSSAASGLVGTGMTVDFAPAGEVTRTLTVVVTGDLNGDGKCTLTDMVQLRSHLLKKSTLKAAALQAADINGDGKCTLTDMVQLRAHLLGRSSIKAN